MTNETRVVPVELLPCPFCGTEPKLPDGDGTQYEIWCEDCGGAVSSVQIWDLMTLEERAADSFTDYRYGEEFIERAKLEAIERWNTRAQPAAPVTTQEPVTLPEPCQEKTVGPNPLRSNYAVGWDDCLAAVKALGPLYTHADASEVERLQGQVDEWYQRCVERTTERDHARDQLAEAHALLRETYEDGFNDGGLCVERGDYYPEAKESGWIASNACKALSASAEPSAPKFGVLAGEPEIIGERCSDGGKCHHMCKTECFRKDGCVPLSGSGLTDDWKEPSAPVDETVVVSRELLEKALKADASQGASSIELHEGWLAMKVLRAALERKP